MFLSPILAIGGYIEDNVIFQVVSKVFLIFVPLLLGEMESNLTRTYFVQMPSRICGSECVCKLFYMSKVGSWIVYTLR